MLPGRIAAMCNSHDPNIKFAEKHAEAAEPNPVLKQLLSMRPRTDKKELSCALAMQLGKSAKVSPAEVGRTLDILEYRINLCQLGLFGHKPVSRILAAGKPGEEIAKAIKAAITSEGTIACSTIWELAKTFKLPKMTMASYCLYLKAKIKPCQLNAF